ncbi:MAG TPA: hypothetical protein VD736_03950 [Nitrososphaera sp.]|nr:hypothetical protein [Nitrososphaera sp.]
MFESDISVEYKRQKDVSKLRKKSAHAGKDVDKLATELDSLKERVSELQEEIRQLDSRNGHDL